MWVYISWVALIPILVIFVFLTIKEIRVYIGLKNLKKVQFITPKKFTKIELKEIDVNYRLPVGQKPFFEFVVPKLEVAQKQRMYTGNTKSGIKLPFMSLSLQNRKFYDTNNFHSWGNARITLTNKLIRIIGLEEHAIKREINLTNLEEIKFVDNEKTIQLNARTSSWPLKIKFSTKEEAIEFQNAIWSIILVYNPRILTEYKNEKNNKK